MLTVDSNVQLQEVAATDATTAGRLAVRVDRVGQLRIATNVQAGLLQSLPMVQPHAPAAKLAKHVQGKHLKQTSACSAALCAAATASSATPARSSRSASLIARPPATPRSNATSGMLMSVSNDVQLLAVLAQEPMRVGEAGALCCDHRGPHDAARAAQRQQRDAGNG